MSTTSLVPIPDTSSGRVTERSVLWDDIVEAASKGVAVRVDGIEAKEAKVITNTMYHRMKKFMPHSKLRTRWIRKEGALLLWIESSPPVTPTSR